MKYSTDSGARVDGENTWDLTRRVNTAQRMKTQSTRERQMRRRWKVSRNSRLLSTNTLVTFPTPTYWVS